MLAYHSTSAASSFLRRWTIH